MLRGIVISTLVCGACASAVGAAQTVKEQAQVPQQDGMTDVTVFKVNKRLETVTCRDFNLVDVQYRPQAIVYAANYGPKGKPHPTVTVAGVEQVTPMVVDACRARPGDQFVSAVQRALAQQRAGMKQR